VPLKFEHLFSLEFNLVSDHPCTDGTTTKDFFSWPTPLAFRTAILNRLAHLSDSELLEAVGAPFDTLVIEEDFNE
jgi:hypothetical protein